MRCRFAVSIGVGALLVGCALLPQDHYDQYLVCPYDSVWTAGSDTMKIFPVKKQDKESGVIETGWTEMGGDERGFGIFKRTSTAFGNKERARMIMTIKRVDEVTKVELIENRERWHLKGGVTSQATRWWPIDPSEEALAAVMTRLNTKLKDQGCSPS